MAALDELRRRLLQLDGSGYRGYRSIQGEYHLTHLTLFVDRAQSDPFAPPSRLRAAIRVAEAHYPGDLLSTHSRRVAVGDFIARAFRRAIDAAGARDLGVDAGGQVVLERTSCEIRDGCIELRFTARLPGAGRTILGRQAAHLLTDVLPRTLQAALPYEAHDAAGLRRHVETVEDAQALRGRLTQEGLVAFVADGSVLPRLSGASDAPLADRVVRFESPPSLQVTLRAPNAGPVVGMGIPAGVTLIVGGGYHGKTTLLQAIQAGVYDHIPGDGRERVVTVRDAVKIRAEDGRHVERVDISPFLTNLPSGVDTAHFSTDDASGSTSQAAAIMEALELGTALLLMDEDTCATNFMVRDELMQRLVPKAAEPITPYIDRVRQVADQGVSTILVVGGSGDYFEVADRVIMMESYRPRDVTDDACRIASSRHNTRRPEAADQFRPPAPRIPLPQSINAETRQGRTRVRARDVDEIRFGNEEIELWTLDQLVDPAQTRAIGSALLYLVGRGYLDGRRDLRAALELLDADIGRRGLGVITSLRERVPPGDLALPRKHEIGAALNRLRSLEVRRTG
ncbi:MAG TPA: ABC-ATPase domain-containing protein [Chloroflexota bacterium]|nr:ABC-ATPase domain-containing protein [Chloroflexota bacterium]